jgi:hypothetical protein
MRLDCNYLKQRLPELPEFADERKFAEQLFSVSGFDEATTVAEQLRGIQFPAVLIEDTPNGYISYLSGFCDYRTISIWIMKKADSLTADHRKQALTDCFTVGTDILRLLIRDNALYEGAGVFLDFARTAYFPRGPIAQNVFGYEFMLATAEELNLSL